MTLANGIFWGLISLSITLLIATACSAGGLVFRQWLKNIGAGWVLRQLKSFEIGHQVNIGGVVGFVRATSAISTRICTVNDVDIFIPHCETLAQPIYNFSAKKNRRLELRLVISHQADVNQAISCMREALSTDSRIVDTSATQIEVAALTAEGIHLVARPQVPSELTERITFRFNQQITESFRRAGVSFPAPIIARTAAH